MKKSCYGILSILLCLFLLTLPFSFTSAFAEGHSTLGYGPLENEIGFPLSIGVDGTDRVWVLDALKSSICIFSSQFTVVSSFSLPISLPLSIHQLDFQPNGDACWLLVNEFLYKLSIKGALLSEINLKTLPLIGMKTMDRFAVVSDSSFLFVENLSNECYLVDISHPEIPAILLSESNNILLVKEVQSYQDTFFLLCQDLLSSSDNQFVFYQISSRGDLLRKESLGRSKLLMPIGFSINSSGTIFLYDGTFQFEIYNSQFSLLYDASPPLPDSDQYRPLLVAFSQKTVLLIHPYKGVFLFDGTTSSLKIPVANHDSVLLLPSAVCGNHQQTVVYDAITQKLHYYYYEIWKSAFKLNFLQNESLSQSSVQVFQSSSTDVFVVWQGVYLRILRVNPLTWSSTEIQIPSYIPPRSTVFIRSEDNRFFAYSWYDSILYSFSEKSDEVTKIQIPKIENPYSMYNCRITVDKSGFVFLFIPTIQKVYVFDTSGILTHYFTLLDEGYLHYSDMKIFQDIVAMCNYAKSTVEFYTKKGEYLYSFGSKGAILYPKTNSAYSETVESLQYPLSLGVFDKTLWITDSGNSRVVAMRGKSNPDLVKIELQIGSKSAYINNNRIDLDAPPFTENGRTLVPLRFIGEAFGASVVWDGNTKKVTYTLGSTIIEVIIGSTIAVVNGEKKNLDVPPKLVNGRTFVPLRFISESFGASVIWEAATKKIYIEFNKNS